MDVPTLVIADSDAGFRRDLVQALEGRYRVHCCRNGMEALELTARLRPALLVMDLLLPELDGISLLEKVAEEELCPAVLVMSPLISSYVEEAVRQRAVGYLIRKPCPVPVLVRRIDDLIRHHRSRAQDALAEVLRQLSFVQTHYGYQCLLLIVELETRSAGRSVTKELYPETGKLADPAGTGKQVERDIRYAIQTAWDHRDPEAWAEYFPGDKKPSNRAFIMKMAQVMKEKRGKWEYVPKEP